MNRYISLPSGENMDVGVLTLLAVRPGHRSVTTLCDLQVVLHQRRRADFEAVDQLGRRRRHHHHEPVQRIGLEAADADLLVALAQRERVDGLACRDVDESRPSPSPLRSCRSACDRATATSAAGCRTENGIVPTIFSVASSMIQNCFGYAPMISVPLPRRDPRLLGFLRRSRSLG